MWTVQLKTRVCVGRNGRGVGCAGKTVERQVPACVRGRGWRFKPNASTGRSGPHSHRGGEERGVLWF